MIEIRNNQLIINDYVIGDEERILAICNKAKKFDELKADFNGGEDL